MLNLPACSYEVCGVGVFYRERAAGMYAVLPFAIAQSVVEIPWLLVQAVVYSCITYFMIWFQISAGEEPSMVVFTSPVVPMQPC